MKSKMVRMFLFLLFVHLLMPIITLMLIAYGNNKINDSYAIGRIKYKAVWESERENISVLQNPLPCYFCHPLETEQRTCQRSFCSQWHMQRQFAGVTDIVLWLLAVNGTTVILLLLLGGVALLSPMWSYPLLALAPPLLILLGVAETLVQCVLLLWFCWWGTLLVGFWLPALLLPALLVVSRMSSWATVLHSRTSVEKTADGIALTRAMAPLLWQRIERLARRIAARPPDHIIIDTGSDFYVTEAPLYLNWRPLYGRKLLLSLPMLGTLSQQQADGVILHELAHFHQGHTAASARLEPELEYLARLSAKMSGSILLLLPFTLLSVYHLLFKLAWRYHRRQHELAADRSAAGQVPPAILIESLIKILAWKGYREECERRGKRGNTRATVTLEFITYLCSQGFLRMMRAKDRFHPFNHHPPISQRMRNLGYHVAEQDYAAIVLQRPENSWLDFLPSTQKSGRLPGDSYRPRTIPSGEWGYGRPENPAAKRPLRSVFVWFNWIRCKRFALVKACLLRIKKTATGKRQPFAKRQGDQ